MSTFLNLYKSNLGRFFIADILTLIMDIVEITCAKYEQYIRLKQFSIINEVLSIDDTKKRGRKKNVSII